LNTATEKLDSPRGDRLAAGEKFHFTRKICIDPFKILWIMGCLSGKSETGKRKAKVFRLGFYLFFQVIHIAPLMMRTNYPAGVAVFFALVSTSM
jgi:hypothetical protein